MDPIPENKTRLEPNAYLLRETLHRQTVLALVFAIAFAVYGVTSLQMIQQYDRNLTLWDNSWPRLLFNTLPCLLLAWVTKRRFCSDIQTARIGMLAFPLLFTSACMVHVWPLIAAGHSGLYGYVHGANGFIIVMTMLMLSPPRSLLRGLLAGFVVMFVLPASALLYRSGNVALLQMFLGDMVLMLPITYVLARRIHMVQRRLAFAEHDLKQRIKPFLGDYVASALYENRYDLLRDRKSQGLILSLDIRGFSRLMRDLGPGELHEFLRQYYSLIGRIVNSQGGHVHKAMGDGHLISFGVMDLPDLSDIPDLAPAVALAEQRRKNELHLHALNAFFEIETEFQALLARFPLLPKEGLGLGGGMAFGDVHLAIYGDESHKREFDISGETVVLSSRLEQYTKILRAENSSWQQGVFSVVITCDLPPVLQQEPQTRSWRHVKPLKVPIPDFPQVRSLWVSSLVTEADQLPSKRSRAV